MGATVGSTLLSVLREEVPSPALAGVLITSAAGAVALLLTLVIYRMNILGTLGALSGAMTNPPALAAANTHAETDLPALTYASIYPVALIFKIVTAQVLVVVLGGM